MEDSVKGVQKKQIILNAAFDTIYENTIGNSNLREIARKAGMSPGNLHYYYPSKEKLLADLLDYLLDSFIDERKTLIEDRSRRASEKLTDLLLKENKHVKKKKEMCVFMDFCINGTKDNIIQQKVQKTYKEWLNMIESVVDEGIAEGAFGGRFIKIIPDLIISLIDGAALRYHVNGDIFNPDEYFESVGDVLMKLLTST